MGGGERGSEACRAAGAGQLRKGLRFGAAHLSTAAERTSACNSDNHLTALTFDFCWLHSDVGSQLGVSDEKIKDWRQQTGC